MVTIPATALQSVVAKVARVVDANHPVEILRNICFRGGTVMGYNQRCGVLTTSPVDLGFCVPAAKLNSILNGFSDGDLSITVQNNTLVLKNGGNTTRLQTTDSKAYPDISPKNGGIFYDGKDFASVTGKVAAFASDDEKAQETSGVGIRGQTVYSVASKGHRVTMGTLAGQSSSAVVVPADAIQDLKHYGEPDKIFANNNVLYAAWQNPLLVYIMGTYPAEKFPFTMLAHAFERPKKPQYDCRFPVDILKAISRILAVSGKKSSSIVLQGSKKRLVLKSEENETGSAEEEFDWDFNYEFTCKLTASYFVDVLKRTRDANLTDLIAGDGRTVRFVGDGFEQLLAVRT